MDTVKRYAKFIVAILGAALTAASQVNLPIPDVAQSIITIVVAVLTAVSVYAVPNAGDDDPADFPVVDGEQ